MGATEIVQALVSPAEKLIDTVRGAIGKVYEPRYVRKMADAEAYRIKKLGEATAEVAMDIPTTFEKDGLSIDASNFEELAKRASSRLAYQEMKKQQNIEAITGYAHQELENAEPVTNEPVDPDWITQFFNLAENVSNEDIQKIWGRILAGKIKCPNSYSYRTLECLKKMTKEEIVLLQRIAPCALHTTSGVYFIFGGTWEDLRTCLLTGQELQTLAECGLISGKSQDLFDVFFLPLYSLSINPTIQRRRGWGAIDAFVYHWCIAIGFYGRDYEKRVGIPVYSFTSSGVELLKIATTNLTSRDLDVGTQSILWYLFLLQNGGLENRPLCITAHRIHGFAADGTPEYDEEDILATYDVKSGYHP